MTGCPYYSLPPSLIPTTNYLTSTVEILLLYTSVFPYYTKNNSLTYFSPTYITDHPLESPLNFTFQHTTKDVFQPKTPPLLSLFGM